MIGRIPIAFVAGLVSFLSPCVLPLVPGYLSTVSAVEAGRLGERGVARRIVVASLPFFAGFTIVFVALGAGVGILATTLSSRSQHAIGGFVMVVFGLTFAGLLPWPERLMAPRMLAGAQRTGSSALLGAAFGTCALACVGPVLGSILALAATDAARGSILLAVYSAGLAVPFVLAAVAFTPAMGAFRQIRDHYDVIRATSGAILVALGLLLFFDRFWWLRSGANRALEAVGLGG